MWRKKSLQLAQIAVKLYKLLIHPNTSKYQVSYTYNKAEYSMYRFLEFQVHGFVPLPRFQRLTVCLLGRWGGYLEHLSISKFSTAVCFQSVDWSWRVQMSVNLWRFLFRIPLKPWILDQECEVGCLHRHLGWQQATVSVPLAMPRLKLLVRPGAYPCHGQHGTQAMVIDGQGLRNLWWHGPSNCDMVMTCDQRPPIHTVPWVPRWTSHIFEAWCGSRCSCMRNAWLVGWGSRWCWQHATSTRRQGWMSSESKPWPISRLTSTGPIQQDDFSW